ncbi:transposase, IS481 family [Bordetella pertussis H918]|nr:transposase, IS481 family [Bordetella pertussis H918]
MAPMAMGPRLEMVQQLIAHQVCVPEAARAYGVTAPTVRKWLGRFLAQGQAGLADASSRPTVSPRAIAPAKALAIVELRRKRLTQARIAQALGVSASTVSRVLARAGLSHLADLEPAEPVVRYEHQAPGDLLHIDIKKLGRIQRPGHRVTGNRRDTVEGAGWDFVFVAIDDHARWPSPTSPRRALPQRRPVPQGRSGLPAPGRDPALAHRQWLGLSQPRLRRAVP